MMPVSPNFTSAPNVGPEPDGLMSSVQRMFSGQAAAPPDPYALTDQQLIQLLTDTRGFCDPGREWFEYGWWRNLMYLLSRQWIYWNPTTRQWSDKRLAKWVPKPVTNIVRTTVLSGRAMLSAINQNAIVSPVGNRPENIAAAQTADDLEPLLADEHDMDAKWPAADFWTLITGNSYLHPHWDKDDPANFELVDTWACTLCQQVSTPEQIVAAKQRCPSCGSQALRQTGQQQKAIIGKGKTLISSPLELLLPMYAQDFAAVDRLVWLTWRPKHQILDDYGADAVRGVTFDTGPQQKSLQLYKALSTTSDMMVSPSSWNMGSGEGQVEGITEQHLWVKPNKQYPQGLYCKFLGENAPKPVRDQGGDGKCVIPYARRDGSPLWPWIHYPFEPLDGRLYAQSMVDVIIQKQDQINQIDSMTQLTAQRMGNPIWLEPKGAEVERFTGEPGLIVRWQPIGSQGAKPERMSGENPPQSFFTMREQFKSDAEELAGTYDILKGAKPSGVEAFAALNFLDERSRSRFTTLFKARGRAYRAWFDICLELERAHGPTERTKAVLGTNRTWTFQSFQKLKLNGDVAIKVEDGSNVPKTALGRRAAIEHANQMGLINSQDPEQAYQVLSELGLNTLAPSLDTDVKSALQEQQDFEEWAQQGFAARPTPALVRKPWHNDKVHLQENRKWMNGDRVRELLQTLDPERQQQVTQYLGEHLMTHEMAIVGQLVDSLGNPTPAASAAAATGPAGGGAPGSGSASGGSDRG
jgi:hypothetical protein